eukprot:TRINITY_DN44361_c0_g1_i4.p1 TRINITY_DN44361_c0_g1~~TRINITY_DN44361_c0_g1_i4.p1  ORF type:complete len:256 (+),score=15.32 TRINITY_DN44361_c0_g1_i4:81-848(+)
MPDWSSLRSGTWLPRACRTAAGSVRPWRTDGVVPMHPKGSQVDTLLENTGPAHIENSVPCALQPEMVPHSEDDGYSLQVPGMLDHGMLPGLAGPSEIARGTTSTNGRNAADQSQGPDTLPDKMAVGSQQCYESADDTPSTCSVLSIDSVKQYLGKRQRAKRTTDDCWLCLQIGQLGGIWICNRSASDRAPDRLFACAHRFKIEGAHVVLGNGEDAVLQIRRGRVFLMNGELVRVGDRLLHYGEACTLVYQKMLDS